MSRKPTWLGKATPEQENSDLLHPKIAPEVNKSPLQRGNTDTLLRSATLGGPEKPGDRRVYLSSTMLSKLLDIARSSPMGRVQVDGAGVRVDLYEGGGHQYEVWTLIGGTPKPKQLPEGIASLPGAPS